MAGGDQDTILDIILTLTAITNLTPRLLFLIPNESQTDLYKWISEAYLVTSKNQSILQMFALSIRLWFENKQCEGILKLKDSLGSTKLYNDIEAYTNVNATSSAKFIKQVVPLTNDGCPKVYEILDLFPDLDPVVAKKILKYVDGVTEMAIVMIIENQAPPHLYENEILELRDEIDDARFEFFPTIMPSPMQRSLEISADGTHKRQTVDLQREQNHSQAMLDEYTDNQLANSQGPVELHLRQSLQASPFLFQRESRNSEARTKLLEVLNKMGENNWTHEQIEGWASLRKRTQDTLEGFVEEIPFNSNKGQLKGSKWSKTR